MDGKFDKINKIQDGSYPLRSRKIFPARLSLLCDDKLTAVQRNKDRRAGLKTFISEYRLVPKIIKKTIYFLGLTKIFKIIFYIY